jgi:hypothetical protein
LPGTLGITKVNINIFTNIAIVLGLVFVGLEFRANTRSDEAERIDSFMSGWNDVYISLIQSDKSSEIYYRGFADPESLTDEETSIFMVYTLRGKIDKAAGKRSWIETVRGFGYRLADIH